ncbi:hypothetical protein [Actinokineospora sp.]|uniref:hypothetical protein n=1 Tax=Actinokineospora sp. TaxID=1872133 RepID=UPI004038223D
MTSPHFAVGDIADADDRVARSAFTLTFAPATNRFLHRYIAPVVHVRRRCPEHQVSAWPGADLCDRCADHVDAYLDRQFRRVRSALSSADRPPNREFASLLDFLASPEAKRIPVEHGQHALSTLASGKSDGPPWARRGYFQLVRGPVENVIADLWRREMPLRGASARPDRDLLTSKWAQKIIPDAGQREIVVKHVLGLRAPSSVSGSSSHTPELLRAGLDLLLRGNPEFYHGNVTGPQMMRRTVAEPGPELDHGSPMWTVPDSVLPPAVPHSQRERCRAAVREFLSGRQYSAKPARRFLADMCDVAYSRRNVELAISAKRLNPTGEVDLLGRIGCLAIEAGLDWLDDHLSAP